ncbi:MAG: carbohydrate binding family 9 domain-containing protein [Phaeodactylibacter sp.]|nr:carbohydrate binding family 9 domain-containing protein [Phaeodactylibacter sp.]
MKRFYASAILLAFLISTGYAQQPANGSGAYRLPIRKAESKIHLDGLLDEPAWQQAEVAEGFYQNFPMDSSFAALQTEVRMAYDEAFLYVGATVYQPREDYIITSLKRDFGIGGSDEFAVNIDPFKDKINGFHFAVTPFNVQREGIIDNGTNINEDWDNKWYSEVKTHPEYWVVEMAIPFRTLRYSRVEGPNTWRVNFTRIAVKQNERSSWAPVPRQFGANHLAFSGLLEWEGQPPKPGLNVSVIPYVTASTGRDYEEGTPTENNFDAGGDIKVAITPSLNLDLTFNPDFSQVEVDRQITNLSRFELFFPERRQFFLENEDLFSKFGFPDARPFFSRRIGLSSAGPVPIIAGARLSGKLDDNWRIGLLNMQTAKVKSAGIDPANYSVGVLQRKVFDRSYVGAVFVNKENFQPDGEGGYELDTDGYNRVAGLEYNLYSADGKWEAELYYHRSFSAENNNDAQSAALFVGHFTRNWRLFLPTQYIGRNFRADAGFVPRPGFFSFSPGITHNIFPKNPRVAEKIIQYGLEFSTNFTYNQPDYRLADRQLQPGAFVVFPGQSTLSVGFASDFTFLYFPFDPTNKDTIGGLRNLPVGEYRYNSVGVSFNSDVRKKFYFDVEVAGGEYFNGDIRRVEGALNFRWQPFGILAATVAYNDIQLPDPYNSASFWLVGPRAELSFSRSLFFSTFLQYNTQANNVNINSRLQWRFRPVSDVFLVYTDNYFSDQFFRNPREKNRALVLKVTYWLNL